MALPEAGRGCFEYGASSLGSLMKKGGRGSKKRISASAAGTGTRSSCRVADPITT